MGKKTNEEEERTAVNKRRDFILKRQSFKKQHSCLRVILAHMDDSLFL